MSISFRYCLSKLFEVRVFHGFIKS